MPPKKKKIRAKHAKKKIVRKPKAKKVRKRTVSRKKPLRPDVGPFYTLNPSFEFFYELRDLILKSSPAEKNSLAERISKLGRVKLAIIAGIFMNKENSDPAIADLLIVGDDIEKRKLRNLLRSLEAEVGKEIKFSVMEKDEFQYRYSMFDRFIRVMLESPHENIIDKLGMER